MMRRPVFACLALAGAVLLSDPAGAVPLPVTFESPTFMLVHGWDRGPSVTLGFGFYAPAPVYPVPVYPAPPPRPAYYPTTAPDPYWLDRHARWARPNHYGGMDYKLYDGRFCRTWRERHGSLAVSCD